MADRGVSVGALRQELRQAQITGGGGDPVRRAAFITEISLQTRAALRQPGLRCVELAIYVLTKGTCLPAR